MMTMNQWDVNLEGCPRVFNKNLNTSIYRLIPRIRWLTIEGTARLLLKKRKRSSRLTIRSKHSEAKAQCQLRFQSIIKEWILGIIQICIQIIHQPQIKIDTKSTKLGQWEVWHKRTINSKLQFQIQQLRFNKWRQPIIQVDPMVKIWFLKANL